MEFLYNLINENDFMLIDPSKILRKTLIHLLFVKPQTPSKLESKIASCMNKNENFQTILEQISIFDNSLVAKGIASTYQIKPELWNEFDVHFSGYSISTLQKAQKNYLNYLKTQKNQASHLEDILYPLREAVVPEYIIYRDNLQNKLLLNPILYKLIFFNLFSYVKNKENSNYHQILNTSIHLLYQSLAFHLSTPSSPSSCFHSLPEHLETSILQQINKRANKNINHALDIQFYCELKEKEEAEASLSAGEKLFNYLIEEFTVETEQTMKIKENDKEKEDSHSILSLFTQLFILKPPFQHELRKIIEILSNFSKHLRIEIENKIIVLSDESIRSNDSTDAYKKKMKEIQQKRQKEILEKFKQQQSKFLCNSLDDIDEFDDIDGENFTQSMELETDEIVDDPAGELCCICNSPVVGELFGRIGYLHRNNIIHSHYLRSLQSNSSLPLPPSAIFPPLTPFPPTIRRRINTTFAFRLYFLIHLSFFFPFTLLSQRNFSYSSLPPLYSILSLIHSIYPDHLSISI